ncbi:MAG: peptidase M50 [Methanomicrobiales archaeon]|nr:peptidase M50 [Methanomicrobiales archaeon]
MLERIPPREWKDLLIAWLAISLAFTLIFVRSNFDIFGFLIFFSISLVTVGIGFVLHEMAHKFTAMRFGFWAEFRKDTQMLLIAVVLAALAGIVFAAPGATVIYGASLSREQNGKISIAGPLTNLILCVPFGLIYLGGLSGLLGLLGLIIGTVGFQVNAMIAFFNMLPVSVLDGRKILSWNLPVFIILFLATLGVLYLSLTSLYITGISF